MVLVGAHGEKKKTVSACVVNLGNGTPTSQADGLVARVVLSCLGAKCDATVSG